ncbi:MAG: TonB-dependent receptor [Burkholderiaceae bacterium]|nr:TonB-dependent receptor [Burkholderiaceae bacterium]
MAPSRIAADRAPRRPAAGFPPLPLAALAAGLGLTSWVQAQTPTAPPAPAAAASAPAASAAAVADTVVGETRLRKITVKGRGEAPGKDSLKAETTRIGKGRQELRDIPQSVTVVTEKLILDRHLDTLKDTLKNTAGISFLSAEGGEEDVRLRGFSLQASGDIFIDGMRDPAFYERDSFHWDRLELLRGSASMLFGRGSTGGAANQVSKQPELVTRHQVDVTLGSGSYLRGVGDFNVVTGEDAALRVVGMSNLADNDGAGNRIDKEGLAATYAWGIGTRNEFQVGLYHLKNRNGIHYGLPWLESNNADANHLWKTDPAHYYGAASDRNHGSADYLSLLHVHRFQGGGELRTQARVAEYERDLRASAIRFAAASLQPGGAAVTHATFGDGTVLTRGNNVKIQDMRTKYLQSDFSRRFKALGMAHQLLAGVDAAREDFENFGGSAITKPRTTVGTPDDGGGVDESTRVITQNRAFTAKGLGVYAQDLLQIAPMWKLLGGLRWDRFEGTYHNLSPAASTNVCAVAPRSKVSRSDSLMSKRFGVLFQPTPYSSYHLSYGTSFNTSGDAYQYDAGTVNTDPESSRNVELGAKLDAADGQATMRVALFHSTKYNERNRDAETADACNYVLSGKRHAAGLELDFTGRITPAWEVYGSYAWIPSARVDRSSGAAGTEAEGSRPGLTPRHTGTIWTTYQLTPQARIGGGLNARSSDKPAGLAATSPLVAPSFVTVDLMGEYRVDDALSFKVNVNNLADRHYADMLYRGHYQPGKGRTVLVTGTYRF